MRKKHLFLTLMSAIALTGTVGFTSCSSDDTVAAVEDNPTYDPVAKTVNTQFVLNVASPEMQSTRQSAATVQQSSNFRGMTDAKLIALSTGKVYDSDNSGYWLAPYSGVATSGYAVNKPFNLGTLYTNTQVSNSGTNNANNSSHRVLQMSLPLTTDAMLVYARAIRSQSYDPEIEGKVTMNITNNPENSTFDLASRIEDDGTAYQHTLDLSAAIINQIFDSEILEQAKPETEAQIEAASINGYSNAAAVSGLTWKSLGDTYRANLSKSTDAIITGGTQQLPLEEVLGKLYYSVTTIKSGEYRAGSSFAVRNLVYSIYKEAKTVYTGVTVINDKEYNAQRLAKEIMDRIEKYFTGLTAESTTAFNTIGDEETANTIAANLKTAASLSAGAFATSYSDVTDDCLAGFPSCFRLPEGVALLSIDETFDVFSYIIPSTTLLNGSNIAVGNYMYPAELLYFDNSLLRVSNVAKQESEYPNGYSMWNNPTSGPTWGDWSIGKVASTTRSVAVKNNINYGVAMLKTSVSLDGTTFYDNRKGMYSTETNQELKSTDVVEKFKLKGVLIGGQNHQMGWNYLAKKYEPSTEWDYVIYDTDIPNSGAIPTPDPNYTLVFDNYTTGSNTTDLDQNQQDVYVALEFVNNSTTAFYGEHNLIPVGGTFYLVAKLALDLSGTPKKISTWDDFYAVPPYTGNGESAKVTRVFVQDYMTQANFKIGPYSLQHAYLTVPDLRSTQISLGLSVDLKWQTGLEFEDVLLGGGQIH